MHLVNLHWNHSSARFEEHAPEQGVPNMNGLGGTGDVGNKTSVMKQRSSCLREEMKRTLVKNPCPSANKGPLHRFPLSPAASKYLVLLFHILFYAPGEGSSPSLESVLSCCFCHRFGTTMTPRNALSTPLQP